VGSESNGLADVVPLAESYAEVCERCQIFPVVNALRDDGSVDVRGKREPRHNQRAPCVTRVHTTREVPVDLDEVRTHLSDHKQILRCGAGLIDGDAETAAAEVGNDAAEAGHVGHPHTLLELQHEVMWPHASIGDKGRKSPCSIGREKRSHRHVEEESCRTGVRRILQRGPDARDVELSFQTVRFPCAGAPAQGLVAEHDAVAQPHQGLHRNADASRVDEGAKHGGVGFAE